MDPDRKIALGQDRASDRLAGLPVLGYHPAGPPAEPDLDALCRQLKGTARPHRTAVIGRTIEASIIPRLLLFSAAASATGAPARDIPVDEVADLTRFLLQDQPDAALARLRALQEQGFAFDRLCLELLAPCARLLGRMWEEDLCDFVAVTLGLVRLHRLLREIAPEPPMALPRRDARHRVLLGAAPGEQHSFGLELVAEFFRQDGWHVRAEASAPPRELAAVVCQEWFAVAGLSASTPDRLEGLAAAIVRLRRASANTSLGILLGGPVFIGHPELVTQVGADAMACDGKQAVEQAHRLFALLASPA